MGSVLTLASAAAWGSRWAALAVSRRNPSKVCFKVNGKAVWAGISQADFNLLSSGVACAECQTGKSEVVILAKFLRVTVWRHLASIPLVSPPETFTTPLIPCPLPKTCPAWQHLHFSGLGQHQNFCCLLGSFCITRVKSCHRPSCLCNSWDASGPIARTDWEMAGTVLWQFSGCFFFSFSFLLERLKLHDLKNRKTSWTTFHVKGHPVILFFWYLFLVF